MKNWQKMLGILMWITIASVAVGSLGINGNSSEYEKESGYFFWALSADSIEVVSTVQGYQSNDVTYNTARDKTTADQATNSLGQSDGEYVSRFFGYWDLTGYTSDTMTIDSTAVLYNIQTDLSDTDFDFAVYSAYSGITFETTDFPKFSGRGTGGAAHTPLIYTETHNTAGRATSKWYRLADVNALKDSVTATLGSNLQFVFLSSRDISATAPTQNEIIDIYNNGTPKLKIYYTPTAPVIPTSLSATDSTFRDSVVVTWTKGTNCTGYIIDTCALSGGVYGQLDSVGDVTAYIHSSLNPGVNWWYRLVGVKEVGSTNYYTDTTAAEEGSTDPSAYFIASILDSTHNTVIVSIDTALLGEAEWDSFKIFSSIDSSTQYWSYTLDTSITIDTLSSLTDYSFLMKGYNADTVRTLSNVVTVTTDSLPKPYEFVLDDLDTNKVMLSLIDTSGSLDLTLIFIDTFGILSNDTLEFNGTNPDTLRDTLSAGGLPDSLVAIEVILLNASGDTTVTANDTTLQFYLMAAPVPAVTAIDTSDTLIQIMFSTTDINPDSGVYYQLLDSTLSIFISPDGDTVGIDTSWFVKATWDTVDYHPLSPNTLHELYVNSRNSDDVETGFLYYDSLWTWAQTVNVDTSIADAVDSVTIKIGLSPRDNPSYTFYALEDSITGFAYDLDNMTFGTGVVSIDSTWQWYTYDEWGDSTGVDITVAENTRYVLRFYSKDGNIRE